MPQQTIRLGSTADVVSSVPYLLGFKPAESVVCVALHDKRVCMTARVDLADVEEVMPEVVEAFQRSNANRALVIGCSEALDALDLQTSTMRAAMALEGAGIDVHESVAVSHGEWLSLDDGRQGMVASDSPIALSFAQAQGGHLNSREAVMASCLADPETSRRLRAVDVSEPMHQVEAFAVLLGWQSGDADLAAASLYRDAIEPGFRDWLYWLMGYHFAADKAPIDPELKRIGIMAGEINGDGTAVDGEEIRCRVREWARNVWDDEPMLAAWPLTIGAFSSWLSGDGVRAKAFLERLHGLGLYESQYPGMAVTVEQMIHQGIGPERVLNAVAP